MAQHVAEAENQNGSPGFSKKKSKKDLKIKGDTLNARKHLRFVNYRHGVAEYRERSDYPEGVTIIGVEKGGKSLSSFKHPARAVYLLGGEDHGLEEAELAMCDEIVTIEAARNPMYNVSIAASLVMYHRYQQFLPAAGGTQPAVAVSTSTGKIDNSSVSQLRRVFTSGPIGWVAVGVGIGAVALMAMQMSRGSSSK